MRSINHTTLTTLTSRMRDIITSPRLRTASTYNPKNLATASPKTRALAAGGALAFITAVTAPTATAAAHTTPDTTAAVTTTDAATKTGTKTGTKATSTSKTKDAPGIKQLHPTGIHGSQADFPVGKDQMSNAKKIIEAGQSMGLSPRAWVIALATSMQETKLHNYGDLGNSNDHDSLGLFQQRPSSGWGSEKQIQDPTYSAKAFYKALKQVPHWDKMPLTDAAQAVQVSAFGDRYAQWEAHAGDIVDAYYGQGPLAHTMK